MDIEFSDIFDNNMMDEEMPPFEIEETEENVSNTLIPRPYQMELEEISMKKNSIIHLPTGSGKTFIAVQLIQRMKKDLLKPWGSGGKRTVFLVNTIVLVTQQMKVIQNFITKKIRVKGYSGEDGTDHWDHSKWQLEIFQNQIMVMTSQILLDMLLNKFISLEDLNLIIFDECHHAVIDHPMRSIMKLFEHCPVNKQPRVVGLTATLLNGNVSLNKLVETVKSLETTFHATIASVNDYGHIKSYSTNPMESLVVYVESPLSQESLLAIKNLQRLSYQLTMIKLIETDTKTLKYGQKNISIDPKKINKKVVNIIKDMIHHIETLGMFGGSLAILAHIIQLERIKHGCEDKQLTLFYKLAITGSTEARAILEKAMENIVGFDKLMKYSSQKIIQLLLVLQNYNPEKSREQKPLKLSCIIFTQQRFMAKIVYTILKMASELNPKDFGFIKTNFMVGYNMNPYNDTRELHYEKKKNESALVQFRNGSVNCLVTTSVTEEGIDIPSCSLVIRYDFPLEYRSYVQSKGRARNADSKYILLVPCNEQYKYECKVNQYNEVEAQIRQILCQERTDPEEKDIKEQLYNDNEIPSCILPSGATLIDSSAISILNRYCSLLPKDKFTILIPNWIKESCDELIRVIITMPIGCPIKEEIVGDFMTSLKSAKRSAAVKACIKLLEANQFEEGTFIPKPYAKIDYTIRDVKMLFPHWKEETIAKGIPIPGTKKRIGKHKNWLPKCLQGSTNYNHSFYLHIIQWTPSFDKPTNSRDIAMYELLTMPIGYGLLTTNKLPTLCQFPLFINIGQLNTEVLVNNTVVKIDFCQFELVKRFHYMVFDEVLEVAKKFQAFDGKKESLYVVPLKNTDSNCNVTIDWDVMRTHETIEPTIQLSSKERKNMVVKQNMYKYSVVTPWYRCDLKPRRYIVSNVLQDKSPLSSFDNDHFNTYQHYFNEKYKLDILGSVHQPLLEVKCINTRMNCLLPRAATIKQLTSKQMKLITANQGEVALNEVLVPEYCVKHKFPGVLWYKGLLLPSTIHRLIHLLKADELRMTISQYIGYGKSELHPPHKWRPMEFSIDVARNSLLSEINEPNTASKDLANSVDRMNTDKTRIFSVTENLRKQQLKKISEQYSWREDEEPIDIERNIDKVKLMDIQCYQEFVMTENTEKETPKTNFKQDTMEFKLALTHSTSMNKDSDIKLLTKTPSPIGIELVDVLCALTTNKSNDICNLERMETLGDSFLKFATTTYLYYKYPMYNEGQLTNIKCRLLGNRNLFYAGCNMNIPGYMKTEHFAPACDFIVPSFSTPEYIIDKIDKLNLCPTVLLKINLEKDEILSGNVRNNYQLDDKKENIIQSVFQMYTDKVAVADKCVADCVEALLGAYLESGGLRVAHSVLQWFQILPRSDHSFDFLTTIPKTVLARGEATVKEIEFLLDDNRSAIEEIIGYRFRDPSLLLEAMSHSSWIKNRKTFSYERLEFLGDALLDFLITSYIYENYTKLKPGQLTDLRSSLVNNIMFATYVVKLGLYKHILWVLSPMLFSAIQKFVEYHNQQDVIDEDVLYLIDEEECNIAQCIDVPKVLSDVFESLAGAIYLDTGGDLSTVWRVYYKIMHCEIDKFAANTPIQPVRLLLENVHACPFFYNPKLIEADIPVVVVAIRISVNGKLVVVHGFGPNKRQAKRAAAKMALRTLEMNS